MAEVVDSGKQGVDPLSWIGQALVAETATIVWDAEADVVVVGVGGAGACAALQAAEDGASVIAIDRFDSGGSTAWSGGIYYGGNTRFQREAGIDDTVDNMFAYLKQELRGSVSDETLGRFCEESADSLEWLVKHGVRFDATLTDVKAYYPPAGAYLYYSGNERLPEYKAIAKPAPRGHRAFAEGNPNGNTGWAFFPPLKAAIQQLGVSLITHAAVDRLIVDPAGRVIGVEMLVLEDVAAIAEHKRLYEGAKPKPFNHNRCRKARSEARALELRVGVRKYVRARNGVILSTGGFEVNAEILARECKVDWSKGLLLGMLGSDGSGMALGRSVGGTTSHLDYTFVGQRIVPPQAYLTAILVGKSGKRLISEEAYISTVGLAMAEVSEGKGWIVLDRPAIMRALRDALPDRQPNKMYAAAAVLNILIGGTRVSHSIMGLARKMGVDREALAATVDRYNRAAAGEMEDDFGKPKEYLRAIEKGPFFAVNISFDNRLQFVSIFTLGGLRVDENSGLVLKADGTTVAGLYAAGRAASGLPSISYVSGLSISDCVFSGRRAGRSAAGQPGM